MPERRVDMSPAAIARRLQAINELRKLGLSLRQARRADVPAAPR
jgi:hypothetical protein